MRDFADVRLGHDEETARILCDHNGERLLYARYAATGPLESPEAEELLRLIVQRWNACSDALDELLLENDSPHARKAALILTRAVHPL